MWPGDADTLQQPPGGRVAAGAGLGAPEDPALRDPELALLSSACDDLAGLLREVAADLAALGVPVEGVVSDGQHSIRLAISKVWPDVPHQLCHFHYLREAALPIFEADRHAKKELKKTVRGVRPIERRIEGRTDAEAQIVQGYCAAVRSALTD